MFDVCLQRRKKLNINYDFEFWCCVMPSKLWTHVWCVIVYLCENVSCCSSHNNKDCRMLLHHCREPTINYPVLGTLVKNTNYLFLIELRTLAINKSFLNCFKIKHNWNINNNLDKFSCWIQIKQQTAMNSQLIDSMCII